VVSQYLECYVSPFSIHASLPIFSQLLESVTFRFFLSLFCNQILLENRFKICDHNALNVYTQFTFCINFHFSPVKLHNNTYTVQQTLNKCAFSHLAYIFSIIQAFAKTARMRVFINETIFFGLQMVTPCPCKRACRRILCIF